MNLKLRIETKEDYTLFFAARNKHTLKQQRSKQQQATGRLIEMKLKTVYKMSQR